MTKKTAKRLLAVLLSALLLLSLAACGSHSGADSQPDKDSPTVRQTNDQKQGENQQDEAKTEETGKDNTNTGETGKETSDKDTAGKDVSGSENSTKDNTQKEDNKTTSGSDSSNGSSSNGSSSGGGSAAGGNGSSGGSSAGGSSSGGSASQPEPPASKDLTCTISISCSTILNNMDKCEEAKKEWVPDDGVILRATTVTFTEGESVYDVLERVCRDNGIQMEASVSKYGAYVKGIANLNEKDVGDTSGWMYKVNGWFPNYGCSGYTLSQGDVISWVYTCDLGDDVGGGYAT